MYRFSYPLSVHLISSKGILLQSVSYLLHKCSSKIVGPRYEDCVATIHFLVLGFYVYATRLVTFYYIYIS